MVKTIGRSRENDLSFDKSHVSEYHARVTLNDDNTFLVEDRAIFGDTPSTNGTYVNRHRIQKMSISINDELRVSDEIVDLEKLFGLHGLKPKFDKTDPKDFSNEFFLLKEVYYDYRKKRRKVLYNHQLKTSIIRATIMLSPLGIYYLLQHLKVGEDSLRMPLSVVTSSAAMFVTGFISPLKALDFLEDQFRIRYVCPAPGCKQHLGSISWEYHENLGKCRYCGAKYKTY